MTNWEYRRKGIVERVLGFTSNHENAVLFVIVCANLFMSVAVFG